MRATVPERQTPPHCWLDSKESAKFRRPIWPYVRHWRPPDTVKQMRDGFAENYGDLPWTNEFNDTDEVSLGLVPAYRAWEADVPF